MKYLIICMLFVSCSIFRKSVNQVKKEANKSNLSITDSIGKITIDSSRESHVIRWGTVDIDSSYDIVIEEVIKEVIDSNVTHRETTRITKERGQKRTEESSAISHKERVGIKMSQNSTVNQLQRQDSSSVINATQKNISRSSILPWWMWLIAIALIALGWWQRNPIIEFFKSKR